jgi:hypothetical protein
MLLFRVLCYEVLDANGNAEAFRQFLHRVDNACNARALVQPIIVLDNVRFHRSQIIMDEFAILQMEPSYLPPYSPFFNPIENMFSQWKNYVKRQEPKSNGELLIAMHHGCDLITPEDCSGYVAKVNDNCIQCAYHGKDLFDN